MTGFNGNILKKDEKVEFQRAKQSTAEGDVIADILLGGLGSTTAVSAPAYSGSVLNATTAFGDLREDMAKNHIFFIRRRTAAPSFKSPRYWRLDFAA